MEDHLLGYRRMSPEYWTYEDRNANYTVASDQIKIIDSYDLMQEMRLAT
jgi:hypothetical protein